MKPLRPAKFAATIVAPTFVRAGQTVGQTVGDERTAGRVRTTPSIERTVNARMARVGGRLRSIASIRRGSVVGAATDGSLGRRMRYVVVFAHPDVESFSGALCRNAVDGLREAGHHVDLIDLYAEGFDPRMSTAERQAYESPNPILSAQIEHYADLVRQAQGLVFVYPTWWWGLPAIMKGWLERVLVPGVSFVLDPKTNKVKAGLGQIRHVVGISTYGSSRTSMRLFNDAGRRNVVRGVRVLAPPVRCRTTWLGMYSLDRATAAQREAFLSRVKTDMRGAR